MSTPHLSTRLLRLSLPLIPAHGFTLETLQLASRQLSSTQSSYSPSTLSALFPSPPSRSDPEFKRHVNGQVRSKRSLSREELIREARGEVPLTPEEAGGPKDGDRGHGIGVGPVRALVMEWLEQGRKEMIKDVGAIDPQIGQDRLVRQGLKARLRYNEPVVDKLVEALALLGTPTSTPLSSPTALLPFPSPLPHFEHVARIAHDLAQASRDESQGVEWYTTRARLGTIYGLAELHQLSPELSGLDPSERTNETVEFVDRLLKRSEEMGRSVGGVGQFANWVGRSWMGMGRSLGL